MNTVKSKVLVYGASGSQSSPVVYKLLAGGHQVLAVSRSPEKSAPLRQAGARVVAADMSDYEALRAASEGVDAVSLQVPAFVPNPVEQPRYFRNAVDAAKAAGVKMLVYNTSGPIIQERTGNPMFDLRLDLVSYLQKSGVAHMVIQPTLYLENLLGPWTLPRLVAEDVLAYPVEADQRLGWIATQDVASLMVTAIERPELADDWLQVSGVENLTGPELAERFSEGLGRKITYYPMPLAEFGAFFDRLMGPGAGQGAMAGYQFQRDNAQRIPMWTDMRTVLEKLPVPMTSVADWAAQHRQAFAKAQ